MFTDTTFKSHPKIKYTTLIMHIFPDSMSIKPSPSPQSTTQALLPQTTTSMEKQITSTFWARDVLRQEKSDIFLHFYTLVLCELPHCTKLVDRFVIVFPFTGCTGSNRHTLTTSQSPSRVTPSSTLVAASRWWSSLSEKPCVFLLNHNTFCSLEAASGPLTLSEAV